MVSRQLGHADPKITASTYAHLLGDSELDRAATVFDSLGDAQTLRETLREPDTADEIPVVEPDHVET